MVEFITVKMKDGGWLEFSMEDVELDLGDKEGIAAWVINALKYSGNSSTDIVEIIAN